MAWRVEFLPAADKTFGKLDRQHQLRIKQFVESRLETDYDPRRIGEAYVGRGRCLKSGSACGSL